MRPTDRQGNALSGANQEAVEYYEQAAQAFHLYRGDPSGPLDRALQIAPGFAMAHLLKAHLLATAAEPEATRKAREVLAEAQRLDLDEREASHVAALASIVEGNWTAGAVAFDYHNVRYPHDLLALQTGHLADFYRACSRNLRDRIARLLQALREHPGQSEAAQWARGTGLALAEGFVSFWYRDYDKAARLLHPARYMANQFGGSNAQRDIIDWTLGEAALRGGLRQLAQALAAERLALKPHSWVNLSMRSRAGGGTA